MGKRTRSKRHRGAQGLTYQAFRNGDAIEVRVYASGRRLHRSATLLVSQWPEHPFDQWRLLDILVGDWWIDSGPHVDAAQRAVAEVINA